MQGREAFLGELLEKLHKMIDTIEKRELEEPDFSLVREFAEQLKDEVDALLE